MINATKRKLHSGKNVIGCFLGFHSEAVVEMLGYSGFDFIVIDNEHGSFSWGEVEQLVRAADLTQVTPIVRVAYGPSDIQKALDRGAQGIHMPMVSTKEDAELVVRRAKFPPLGQRGTAYSVRSFKYGKEKGLSYLQSANEEILVVVHIETPQSIENIEDIAGVKGLDVIFVGPTDLSVTMGYAKEGPGHPEVQKAMNHVLKTCARLGVPVGTLTANAEGVAERMLWGARYLNVGITTLLAPAFAEVVQVVAEKE